MIDHFPNLKKEEVSLLLGELLAVIHRDGGHHIADVGVEQACKDAEAKILNWIQRDDHDDPERSTTMWGGVGGVEFS